MSSVLIPKEELTAFQRWELASFDQPGRTGAPGKIELATVAELEHIRQQAYDEGYAQGKEAGYAAGAQQIRTETGRVHALMQQLHSELNQVDAQLAQSLLGLALEVGRKMVAETLLAKPEVILGIVSEAIGGLPHFNQHAHLVLHPDDAELVRKHMGDQLTHSGWKLMTDDRITRGGCRVETAHTRVDATVETRWKRIVESIGEDKSWLP